MARAHEVAIGADGRAFNQAIKSDVIKPLDEAARSLDDLADAGEDAGRDSARGLDRLEDALKDAQRQSEKTERAVEDIGDGGVKSFGRVHEGAQEVTQEIGQNLGEAVSSIRGDMSDLAQVGQDTLGGLAATIASTGPAGLVGAALLAAGAIGAGGITAALEEAEQRRQELAERANSLAQAYIDAGAKVVDAMTIATQTSEILTSEDTRREAEDLARVLGIDLPTAARAMAGDANALALANAIVADSEEERLNLMRQSADYMSGDYTKAEQERLTQLQDQITKVDELNGVSATAAETFDAQQKVLGDLIRQAGTATEEVDELGNVLYTLPDGTQIMIDAKTKQATTDITRFRGDLDKKIPTVKTTTVRVGIEDRTTAAVDRIVRRINGRVASIQISAGIGGRFLE